MSPAIAPTVCRIPDPDALKAQIATLLKQIADATAELAETAVVQTLYGSVGTAGLAAAAQRHGLPLIRINVATPYRIEVWNETEHQWLAFSGQWLQNVLKTCLLPCEEQKQLGCIEKWRARLGKESSEVYETHNEPHRDFTNLVYARFSLPDPPPLAGFSPADRTFAATGFHVADRRDIPLGTAKL